MQITVNTEKIIKPNGKIKYNLVIKDETKTFIMAIKEPTFNQLQKLLYNEIPSIHNTLGRRHRAANK